MASYYSGAGDGYCDNYTGAGWDAVHDRTTCNEAFYNDTYIAFDYHLAEITRLFFPIDTSGIDDSINIVSANFYTFFDSTSRWGGVNNGTYWAVVVQTTQASPTALVVNDYDNCGAIDNPTEGSSHIDLYLNPSSLGYISFPLTSTGLTWIKKTAGDPYTMLGLRTGYDVTDTPVTTSLGIYICLSNYPGQTRDPYLDVRTGLYSRGDYSTLPTGTDDLENLFTANEYTQVATDDSDRVEQRGGA